MMTKSENIEYSVKEAARKDIIYFDSNLNRNRVSYLQFFSFASFVSIV